MLATKHLGVVGKSACFSQYARIEGCFIYTKNRVSWSLYNLQAKRTIEPLWMRFSFFGGVLVTGIQER
jgi:hypothetical protein